MLFVLNFQTYMLQVCIIYDNFMTIFWNIYHYSYLCDISEM